MELPLYYTTSQKNGIQSTEESKKGGKSSTAKKNKTFGVENTIEIQLEHNHGQTYIANFFLTWLSLLPLLILLIFLVNHKMEAQRLEVAHLKSQMSLLSREIHFLREQFESMQLHVIDQNSQNTTIELEEEENVATNQNPSFVSPRKKRNAVGEMQTSSVESSPFPRKLRPNNSARRGKQPRKKLKSGLAQCRRQCQRRLSNSNIKRSDTLAIHLKGAHPEIVVDAGRVGPWFIDSKSVDTSLSSSFQLRESGESVEIETSGLYFVYAQVYYLTSHALNSFTIMLVPKDSDHLITLAYCSCNAASANSTSEVSCFTAALHSLQAGDRIYIQQREKRRRLIMRPGYSFLGLIKFSDS